MDRTKKIFYILPDAFLDDHNYILVFLGFVPWRVYCEIQGLIFLVFISKGDCV